MPRDVVLTRTLAVPSRRGSASQPWGAGAGAEELGKALGLFHSPIDDVDGVASAREQRPDDRARGTARPQHHGRAGILVPALCRLVEIGEKAVGVRVGAVQAALVEPQGVDGLERAANLVDLVAGGKGGLFVRQRDVAADEAVVGKPIEKRADLIRRHTVAVVGAVDAIFGDPVVVDDRRAGMADRPSDDAGAQ